MTRATLRITPAALLVLAAACASGASTGVGTSAQTTTTIYTGSEGSPLTSVSTDAPVASTISTALRPDSAAVQLQAAYAVVGIPITLQDAATGRLGNPRFVTRSRIANEPMSRFLNCGQTLTGNRADRDQITISIVSTVRPGPRSLPHAAAVLPKRREQLAISGTPPYPGDIRPQRAIFFAPPPPPGRPACGLARASRCSQV